MDLSDRSFLDELENHRGKGRNDYSIELLWRGSLASIAYQVTSIEEMRRKMKEQPDLFPKIPSSFSFSRFFTFLSRHSEKIEALLMQKAKQIHPTFGRVIAIGEIDGIHFLWEPQFNLPLFFCKGTPQKLLEHVQKSDPSFFQRCKYLLADSSYEELIPIAWDRFRLRAVIPKMSVSESKTIRGATVDAQGMVYCKKDQAMVFAGFEESRNTLKYRCIVRHYGSKCEKFPNCPLRSGIRIPLSIDPLLFTPLPRTSYRWGKIFQLMKGLDSVKEMLRSHLCLANHDILCCQLAALLLVAGSKKHLFYSRIEKV